MTSNNETNKPVSSMKLERSASKGLIIPTVHIYAGDSEETINFIRMQVVKQFFQLELDVQAKEAELLGEK